MRGVAEVSLGTDIDCLLVGDEAPHPGRPRAGVPTTPSASRSCTRATRSAWTRTPHEAVRPRRDASLAGRRARGRRGPGRRHRLGRQHRAPACSALRQALPAPAAASGARRWRASTRGRPSTRARTRWRCCSTSARPCAARPTSWCSSRSWAAPTRGASRRCRARASGSSTWGREDDEGRRRRWSRRTAGSRALPMINFVGNVEGNDLVRGRADVIVCEGLRRQRRAEAARGRVRGARRRRAARRRSAGSCGGVGLRLLSQGIERVQRAHRLQPLRRLADPRLRAALHQVPRPLDARARSRTRSRWPPRRCATACPAEIADAVGGAAVSRCARRRRRRAPAGAAPLPLGPRQDLPAQRVRHAPPAAADGAASAARTRSTCPASSSCMKGAARRGRPARPRRRASTSSRRARRRSARRSATSCALDGVPYDGIVFKDQLQHLRRGQVRATCASTSASSWSSCSAAGSTRRPRRASCSSATTGSPTRSSTRSTPTWSPARLAARRARRRSCGASASTPRSCPRCSRSPRRVAGARRRRAHLHQPRAPDAAGVVPRSSARASCRPSTTSRRRVVLAADGWLDPEDVAARRRARSSSAPGYTPRRLENSLADLVRRGCVAGRTPRTG